MSDLIGQPPTAMEFVLEPADTPTPNAPIADLSYRSYDGPLHTRAARWWIVTLASLRLAVKKKGFWIAAAISLLPYLIILLQLYLQSRATAIRAPNPLSTDVPGQKFAAQFF